jgi:hypothetical protein
VTRIHPIKSSSIRTGAGKAAQSKSIRKTMNRVQSLGMQSHLDATRRHDCSMPPTNSDRLVSVRGAVDRRSTHRPYRASKAASVFQSTSRTVQTRVRSALRADAGLSHTSDALGSSCAESLVPPAVRTSWLLHQSGTLKPLCRYSMVDFRIAQ